MTCLRMYIEVLNKFLKGISPSVRMISIGLLILCLFSAKSIYLIIFITILTLILILIKGIKVNNHVNALKNSVILLLILLVVYIIIFKEYNIFNVGLFLIKSIIGIVLIMTLTVNMEFGEIHEGLYGILLPIKKLNVNIEKISLDIVLSIYFIKFLALSNKQIQCFQKINGKTGFDFKHRVFPSIVYSVNKLENLQNNLKIQFYQLKYTKINIRSIIILCLTIIFFIVCIFKEVIL